MEAAENTTDINYPTNHKVTKKYPITTKATKKINTTNDGKNTKIVSNSNLKS
jgi:glutamyl endopeptidase